VAPGGPVPGWRFSDRSTNTLPVTAGPGDEAHGQYGRIDMNWR
jgi:hypothetical protein